MSSISNSGNNATLETIRERHQERVEILKRREEESISEIQTMLRSIFQDSDISQINDLEELRRTGKNYSYSPEQILPIFSNIGSQFLPYYSWCYDGYIGKEKILVKEIYRGSSKRFHPQFIQAYMLWRYFTKKKENFIQGKYLDAFHFNNQKKMLIFMTPIDKQISLKVCYFNSKIFLDTKPTSNCPETQIPLYTLLMKLASAAEYMNLSGIAHRFLTIDNVFIGADKMIKLSGFDFASIFWNCSEQIKIFTPTALGIPLPPEYHEHLPPEAFQPAGYYAANMDVWAIGVILCRFLIGGSPFEFLTRTQYSKKEKYYRWWREYKPRTRIPDIYRAILDEIFKDESQRISLFDLVNNPMTNKNRTMVYYRIDLRDGTNYDGPPNGLNDPPYEIKFPRTPKFNSVYLDDVKKAFQQRSIKNVQSLHEITDFVIDAANSYDDELKTLRDHYFRANKIKDTANNSPMKSYCRVFWKLPDRYLKLIVTESFKILKLCRQVSREEVRNMFIELYDLYMNRSERLLWIFYEPLTGFVPLSIIIDVYPLILSKDADKTNFQLTTTLLIHWWRLITNALAVIADLGCAHRNVKPEYIFINTDMNAVKLTHFDMACFCLNPETKKRTLRTRGLQDEAEGEWWHLPPEIYNPTYDPIGCDVWSMGVLMCFCLTHGKSPFRQNREQDWMETFFKFRQKYFDNLHKMRGIENLLFKIFTVLDKRITIDELDALLSRLHNLNSEKKTWDDPAYPNENFKGNESRSRKKLFSRTSTRSENLISIAPLCQQTTPQEQSKTQTLVRSTKNQKTSSTSPILEKMRSNNRAKRSHISKKGSTR